MDYDFFLELIQNAAVETKDLDPAGYGRYTISKPEHFEDWDEGAQEAGYQRHTRTYTGIEIPETERMYSKTIGPYRERTLYFSPHPTLKQLYTISRQDSVAR